MIKIGIDISLLSKKLTGVGVYIKEMLKYFSEYDEINQYFLYSNDEIPVNYILPQRSILRVKLCNPHLKWQVLYLPNMIREDDLDVYWEPNHCIPIMPKGPKYIVTVHDLAAYLYPQYASRKTVLINRLFLHRTLERADKVIAISKSTKNDIVNIFNIDKKQIFVIYNGDSIYNEKTEYNLEEWKKVKNKYALNKFFLYVGNVHPRKNISIIIRAYKKYCTKIKEPFQLLIAGDFSWNTKEIEQEIAEFPYEGKIIVTGYVSDEELKYLYKYAECLVFPSRYEGFGLPILEAMSVGTRVITSNTSSMPEVAGGAALYLNDLDSYNELEILLEKIQNMSQNDKEIMINAGYIQSQKFSRRKCALAILKLFGDANNE